MDDLDQPLPPDWLKALEIGAERIKIAIDQACLKTLMKELNMDIPECEICGCIGNQMCTYPPKDSRSCHLSDAGICQCCIAGENRMDYRPEEDGQEELPLDDPKREG